MNVALWIIAVVLAAAFLVSGVIKLTVPKERIATSPGGRWVEDFSSSTVKSIGVLEALAAIGLILPALIDVAPFLVPTAAVGLALMMIGAMITHLSRGEIAQIAVNVFYLILAVVVAWGRIGPEPFTG